MIENGSQNFAQLRFYVGLTGILRKGAEDHLIQEGLMPTYLDHADYGTAIGTYFAQKRRKSKLIGDLSIKLEELYFSKDAFTETSEHKQILGDLLPSIDAFKEDVLSVPKTSFQERKDTILKAASLITDLSAEQRIRFLTIMGYKVEEATDIITRLGLSTGASIFLTWASDGLAIVVGGLTTIIKPYNIEISEPSSWLPVVASEVLWIGSVALNGKINADLMRQGVKFCPSILGYSAGVIASKTGDENLQKGAVFWGSIATDTIKEAAVFFGPLAIGANTLIGANLGASLVGYLQALISAGVVLGSRLKGKGLQIYKSTN